MSSLPADNLLGTAVRDNITLAGSAASGWYYDFSKPVVRVGCMPPDGLVLEGAFRYIPVPAALRAFDSWFYECWCALANSPRSAPSVQASCCKYQLWFA
jgi:hypothetical protein